MTLPLHKESAMSDITFILLYVEDVARSAAFYARLLAKPISESSANFALIPAAPGLMPGLGRRSEVAPAGSAPGAGEIAVRLADEAAVEAEPTRWRRGRAHRPAADAHGLRLHLRRPRSRRPSHPRPRAGLAGFSAQVYSAPIAREPHDAEMLGSPPILAL